MAASSRSVRALVSKEKYVEAGILYEDEARAQAAMLERRRAQLEEEQSLQRRLFEKSERELHRRTRGELQERRARRQAYATALREEGAAGREEELELFAVREATQLSRRPLVYSTRKMNVEGEARDLAAGHRFFEAAVMQDVASRMETVEAMQALSAKTAQLERSIEAKAARCRQKDYTVQRSVEAHHRRQELQEQEDIRREEARLAHMRRDMQAAHERQWALLQQHGYVKGAASKTLEAKAHRGTLLERRVVGEQFQPPSLCDLYGASLNQK